MNRRFPALMVVAIMAAGLFQGLQAERKKNPEEPDRVVVQHILVGYKRTVPGKVIDRSKKEAQALAEELFERATGGEDFDPLVKKHTDDRYPGIYTLVNHGIPKGPGEYARDGMVPSFGDVAFGLEIGEVGLARFHAAKSPYGWHVMKRME